MASLPYILDIKFNEKKINQFFNHILSQNDWMVQDLFQYSGKRITLKFADKITFNLIVNDQGLLSLIEEGSDHTDLTISIPKESIQDIILKQDPKNIEISGDVKLAKIFNECVKKINWNIGLDLSEIIGEEAAGLVMQVSKSLFKEIKYKVKNTLETTIEYYQEENKLLAKNYQVDKFNKEVDSLSIEFEQLKRKFKGLK